MWFGKNANKWDDEISTKIEVKTISLEELKNKLELLKLQSQLEQHFSKVLKDE